VHGGETGVGVGLASLKVVEMAAGVLYAGRQLGNQSASTLPFNQVCWRVPAGTIIQNNRLAAQECHPYVRVSADYGGCPGARGLGTDGKPQQAAKSLFSLRIGQP
jgi:hypothetical protein